MRTSSKPRRQNSKDSTGSGLSSRSGSSRTPPNTPPRRGGIRGSASKKSKWEEGLQVIDELLEADSATYKAMTLKQRKALANVKNLLWGTGDCTQLSRSSSRVSSVTFQHVPRDLILAQKKEQKRRARSKVFPKNQPRVLIEQRPSLMDAKRGSSYFILQEYAGVKITDPLLLDDAGSTHGSSLMGPRGVRLSNSTKERAGLYTPQEFKELTKEDQQRLCDLLSWESLSSWENFDIFELNELTNGQPLLFMGWAVLGSPYAQSAMKQHSWNVLGDTPKKGGYTFMDDLKIPPHKLCNYLRIIQQDYHQDNPYHNAIHAADVLQGLHCLIQMGKSTKGHFLETSPNLHLFAILLSAVVHDVDHPGKNNAFQTKLKTELAVVYNDMSVLENWHAACAFARMLDLNLLQANINMDSSEVVQAILMNRENNKDSDCNLLSNATPEEFDTIRNLIIEAVLHTDMTKHFAMVDSAKGTIMQMQTAKSKDTMGWSALMYMLHMADISNQAKPGPLARLWTDRCMSEFFAQGDQEATLGIPISPNCDRSTTGLPESQVGFIKFVVQPAYAVLGDLIPAAKETVLPNIQANLDHWTKELQQQGCEDGLSDDDDDLLSVDG